MKFSMINKVIACSLIPFLSFAVEKFYVSPDGSGNTCTQSAPCSIYTAFEKAGYDGLTYEIYLKGGLYKLYKDLKFEPANVSGNLGGNTTIKKENNSDIVVIDGDGNSFKAVIDNKTNLTINEQIRFRNFSSFEVNLTKGAKIDISNCIFDDNSSINIHGDGTINILKNTFFYSENYTKNSSIKFTSNAGYNVSIQENIFSGLSKKSLLNIYISGDITYLKKNMFKNIYFNNSISNSIEINTNRLEMENNIVANLTASAESTGKYPYLFSIKPLKQADFKIYLWNNTFYKNSRSFDITPNKGFLVYISNKRGSLNTSNYNQSVDIHNNIFELNKVLGCPLSKDVLGDFDTTGTINFFNQKNLFADCQTGEEAKCISANVNISPSSVNYWGTASEMIDPDNGNFALSKYSYATEKGYGGNTDLYPPTDDYFGKTRKVDADGDGNAVIDLGAIEYFPNEDYFISIDIKGSGFGLVESSRSLTLYPGKNTFRSTNDTIMQFRAEADIFSKIVKWEGDCQSCGTNFANCVINLKKDKNIYCVAVFDTDLYNVNIEKNSSYGSVYVDVLSKECNFTKSGDKYICSFKTGKNRYINLYASSGTYISGNGDVISFDKWDGDCKSCGNSLSCSVLVSKNLNCKALFSAHNTNVTVIEKKSGCSMGTYGGNSIWTALMLLIAIFFRRKLSKLGKNSV